VLGGSLSILQGPETEREAVATMMHGVRMDTSVSVRLTNYTKQGAPFVHQVSVEPLRDPTGTTRCFQATSLVLKMPGEPPGRAKPQPSQHPRVTPLWPYLGQTFASAAPPPPPASPPPPALRAFPFAPAESEEMVKAEEIVSWQQSDED